jgi:hypothetical protein
VNCGFPYNPGARSDDELGGYAFADLRVGMCATFADLLSAGEENTAFLHAKIATARFYAEHVLPEAAAG